MSGINGHHRECNGEGEDDRILDPKTLDEGAQRSLRFAEEHWDVEDPDSRRVSEEEIITHMENCCRGSAWTFWGEFSNTDNPIPKGTSLTELRNPYE